MTKIKKFFSEVNPRKVANMKVVALCFLAATTFWLFNALNKDNYSTIVNYPIEIVFDKSEFMAVEELPNKVKIEINGNGWDLLRKYFKVDDSPFLIEISNPASKDYLLTSEIRRNLAENITPTSLVSILDDTLKFNIDKLVTRKIKILPDTTDSFLAKNFRLAGPIKIDPETINIKGPTSILQELDGELKVDLGAEQISKDFNKIIPVSLADSLRQYLTLEEESVQIKFDVVQFLEGNKRLKVKMVNFPKNVGLVQEATSVMMYYLIDERRINDLKNVEFEAVLNYRNRNRQDSTVNVQVNPTPLYLENIRIEPETFRLKYD